MKHYGHTGLGGYLKLIAQKLLLPLYRSAVQRVDTYLAKRYYARVSDSGGEYIINLIFVRVGGVPRVQPYHEALVGTRRLVFAIFLETECKQLRVAIMTVGVDVVYAVEKSHNLQLLYQGTGSYPQPPHGLHLATLRMVSHNPLTGPCLRNASRAYWEHVGVKRQLGGNSGEMLYR